MILSNELIHELGLSKTLDILSIKSGLKEASRIRIRRDQLPYFQSLCSYLGLFFSTGNYEIKGSQRGHSNYSEWCSYAIPKPDPTSFCHIFISTSRLKAEDVRNLDEFGDPEIGLFYGYPACCINRFKTDSRIGTGLNMLFNSYYGFLKIPWQMNVSLSYFDQSLFSYYPCNPFCDLSLRFANKRLEILQDTYPSQLPGIIFNLQQAMLLGDQNLGGVSFSGEWCAEGYSVNTILKKDKESVLSSLVTENAIIATSGNSLLIDGVSFDQTLVRLLTHD